MAAPSDSTQPPDPQSPSLTSLSLLERLRSRDQQAWSRFVGIYGPLVYGWCRKWGMQQCDAQDIVQEVFRAVAGGIGTFRKDGEVGTFRGWLWTIAKNKANTFFSQRARRPEVIGGTDLQARLAEIPDRYPHESTSEESKAETSSLIARAMGVIRGDFQEQTWSAFLRTAIDGLNATKVAVQLQMTPRAVRQAKHRVLERLREEYHDMID